jgi:hypothetical protein
MTKWFLSLIGVAFLLLAVTGCSDDEATTPGPSNRIYFKGVKVSTHCPKVTFTFSMRDGRDHAIVVDPSDLQGAFRIYENREEIDYYETGYFVYSAESFELEVVLVLDFTNSIAEFDRAGAIDEMVSGARALIDQLAATHRLAISEYHDRNFPPAIVADFTADKGALHAALDAFLDSGYMSGSSLCWDAVYEAVALFGDGPSDDDARAVIYLSDGRDTSSEHTPGEVSSLARELSVQIYVIGYGDVTNLDDLRSMASSTDGAYYPAEDRAALEEQFESISRDLGGQYRVSYVSLRPAGSYTARVEATCEGLSGSFEQAVTVQSCDDRVGEITIDPAGIRDGELDLFVRAEHVFRGLNEIRFAVEPTDGEVTGIFPFDRAAGGLGVEWLLAGPDSVNYYTLSSETEVEFGDAGVLMQVSIGGIVGTGVTIYFDVDNSAYTQGRYFVFPDTLVIAPALLAPAPE